MKMLFKTTIISLVSLLLTIIFVSCSSEPQQETTPNEQTEPPTTEQPTTTTPEEQQESAETEQPELAFLIKSGTITDGEHSVSATVDLYSDNTLVLSDFNYDGKAPDVYIAIGNKAEGGEFELIELVTTKLEGVFEDNVISIQLENIEGFNAVSVYCDAYSEDFGSTILNSK